MEHKDTVTKVLKDKSFNRFAALGGSAALAGLIATSEHLVQNTMAQNIGLGAAIVAGAAIFGAAWRAATISDQDNGRTIKSEFSELTSDISNFVSKLRGVKSNQEALDDALSHTKTNSPRFLK